VSYSVIQSNNKLSGIVIVRHSVNTIVSRANIEWSPI